MNLFCILFTYCINSSRSKKKLRIKHYALRIILYLCPMKEIKQKMTCIENIVNAAKRMTDSLSLSLYN